MTRDDACPAPARPATWRELVGAALLATVLVGCCVALVASSAQAQTVTAPINLQFADLVPGQTRTQSQPVSLAHDAQISAVSIGEAGDAAVFSWEVALCSASGGCLSLDDDSKGHAVAHGSYRLEVSVTMSEEGTQQAVDRLDGAVSFVATGSATSTPTGGTGVLAHTGTFVWGAAGLGALLVLVGWFFVVVGRRRTERDARWRA